MDDKVEKLGETLTRPSALEMEIINATDTAYVNKFYASLTKEGMAKLFFADTNSDGGIIRVEGITLTIGSLYSLRHTIDNIIQNVISQQSQRQIVPIESNKPDREPLN